MNNDRFDNNIICKPVKGVAEPSIVMPSTAAVGNYLTIRSSLSNLLCPSKKCNFALESSVMVQCEESLDFPESVPVGFISHGVVKIYKFKRKVMTSSQTIRPLLVSLRLPTRRTKESCLKGKSSIVRPSVLGMHKHSYHCRLCWHILLTLNEGASSGTI